MRRKRRNHLPSFKAKVTVAALTSDLTTAELSKKSDVHPNQNYRMETDVTGKC